MICARHPLMTSRHENTGTSAYVHLFFAVVFCLTSLCNASEVRDANVAGASSPTARYATIDAPGSGYYAYMGTTPVAINSNGEIAGIFVDASYATHSFLRSPSGVLKMIDLPGQGTFVQGMNSFGTTVGYVADQYAAHGFIRSIDGTYTIFDVPGSILTSANGINDTGTITGFSITADGVYHGFVRTTNGAITPFDAPGNPRRTSPSKINAAGTVIGYYIDANSAFHGFVRSKNGKFVILDGPKSISTLANDINANGIVVGSLAQAGSGHSFLRGTNGKYTIFDPPGTDYRGSTPVSVNDSGAIVGYFFDSNGILHGYLRNPDGTIVVLNDPKATSLGTVALGISSRGMIIGMYYDAFTAMHGFLRK